MIKIRKKTAFILAVILLFSMLPVFSFAQTQGAYTYQIEGETAVIIEYDKSLSGEIVIPSSLGGKTVVEIPGYIFQDDTDLTAVVIPEGITYIGDCAFYGCTALADVTVPDSLIGMGRMVFADTPWYAEKSNEDFVYVGNVLAEVNKEKVSGAVTLRNGTKGIAEYAFSGAIGLESITLAQSCVAIGINAFAGCTNLQTVNFPDSMQKIGQNAFRGCEKLKNVTLPAGLTRIDNQTFGNCTSLQSVTISEGVQAIGAGAFMDCTALQDVTFPISLREIGSDAFVNCAALENLYYAGTDEEYSAIYIDSRGNDCLLALKKQDPQVQETTLYKPLNSDLIAIPVGTTIKAYYDAINEDYYYVDNGSGQPSSIEDRIRTKMIVRMKEQDYIAVVLGDTDSDGILSSGDARIALRMSVGLEDDDAIVAAAADVDGDGTITSGDARDVLRASVGLDDAGVWFENL